MREGRFKDQVLPIEVKTRKGVVAFDLAGAESGFPPLLHRGALVGRIGGGSWFLLGENSTTTVTQGGDLYQTFLSGKKVAVCPILRAGMGMLDGVLSLIPGARVGFIGLKRNEHTLEAATYHKSLPEDLSGFEIILMDPMLATGNSAIAAVDRLKATKPRSLKLNGSNCCYRKI